MSSPDLSTALTFKTSGGGTPRRLNWKMLFVGTGAQIAALDIIAGRASRHVFNDSPNDSVGSSHLSWSAGAAYGSGVYGKAAQFDGTNNLVASGNTIHDRTTGDFLFADYIYLGSVGSAQTIFAKKGSGSGAGYRLYVNSSNKLVFEASDGTDVATATGGTTLSATTWYFVVAYRVGTSVYLWLNEAPEGSGTNAGLGDITNTQTFTVGKDSSGASQYLSNGSRIDHLEVYTDDLTTDQLQQKYRELHAGQLAFCEEGGSGFITNEFYERNEENTEWTRRSGTEADLLVYPYSTTIGDYSTPSGPATASSQDETQSNSTDTWASSTSGSIQISIDNPQRAAMKITDTVRRNKILRTATWRLKRNGSASGDVDCKLRKSSDDSVVATATAISFNSISTSEGDVTFTFPAGTLTPNEDFYITVEWAGGDASNDLDVYHGTGDPYAGGAGYHYTPSTYTAIGTDYRGSATYSTNVPANSIDNDTATRWQSSSEANPWVRIELSGSADKFPALVALRPHANTNATQIKIQTSPDGAAWTDKRLINVSLLTMGAYNYIIFNRDSAAVRYLRIYVPDGSSKVLAVDEVKVINPSDTLWFGRHGHKKVLATEASLPLAG